MKKRSRIPEKPSTSSWQKRNRWKASYLQRRVIGYAIASLIPVHVMLKKFLPFVFFHFVSHTSRVFVNDVYHQDDAMEARDNKQFELSSMSKRLAEMENRVNKCATVSYNVVQASTVHLFSFLFCIDFMKVLTILVLYISLPGQKRMAFGVPAKKLES